MKKLILTSFFALTSLLSFSQLIDPIFQEQAIQHMEIKDIQDRLRLSSVYIDVAANQKNTALAIGVIGTLVSGFIIYSDPTSKSNRVLGTFIGVTSGVAFLSLEISSNINFKRSAKILNFNL
jgi:hypothetical protein